MKSKMICKTLTKPGKLPAKQVSLEVDDVMVFVVAIPLWVAKITATRWRLNMSGGVTSQVVGTPKVFAKLSDEEINQICDWLTLDHGEIVLTPEVSINDSKS